MENNVMKWLQEVEHPAKGDKNIVELGMVEKVEVTEGSVTVTLHSQSTVTRLLNTLSEAQRLRSSATLRQAHRWK